MLRTIVAAPALLAALASAGCGMLQHHSGSSGAAQSGMGTGMAGGQPGRMDMARMCEMHNQMTAGKSPAEQQAAIEAHVRSMHGTADPQRMAMYRQMTAQCSQSAPALR